MSQVVNSTAPAIASVSTARLTGVRGASFGNHPIDGTAAGGGVSFDTARFGFQNEGETDFFQEGFDQGRRSAFGFDAGLFGRRGTSPGSGKGEFVAPSETFAALIEAGLNAPQTFQQVQAEGERARGFSGPVTRLLVTYELNSQVIHGTLPVNGTTLSISL